MQFGCGGDEVERHCFGAGLGDREDGGEQHFAGVKRTEVHDGATEEPPDGVDGAVSQVAPPAAVQE